MTWLENRLNNAVGTAISEKIAAFLPQLRTRSSTFTEVVPNSILVFLHGENPSFSYFLEERLHFYSERMAVDVRCLDDDITDINSEGCFVIVCRYLGARQLSWIERHAAQLAGVGMFIDDDVSGVVLAPETPLTYRAKLARLHLWPLRRLNSHLDIVWAPTPTLVALFESNGAAVRLLPPLPTVTDVLPAKRAERDHRVIIGYHATGIHHAEHAFLKPIIDEILLRNENVIFEVTASGRNASIWQDKNVAESRLRILPPLPWRQFALRSRHSPADIALVPLLDGRINRARADTKRIDVSRMGAAAIYSDSEVYGRNQSAGEMLVENDHAAWIAAIQTLVNSESAREIARAATLKAVERMRAAEPTIPGLLRAEAE